MAHTLKTWLRAQEEKVTEKNNNEEQVSKSGFFCRICDNKEDFIAFIIFSPIVVAVGVFGYQILFWLERGYWKSLTAGMILVKILPKSFWIWLADDSAWVGLKKIIINIFDGSLGFTLILFSVVLFMFIGIIICNLQQKHELKS